MNFYWFFDFLLIILFYFYLSFQIITIKNLFGFIDWNIFKVLKSISSSTDNLLIVIEILVLREGSTIYKQDKQEFIEL